MKQKTEQHFLVVTSAVQSHINPGRHLANKLARTTTARITFSTAVSAHRLMYPKLSSPDEEVEDGLVTYIPFSDGYDEGFKRGTHNADEYRIRSKINGIKSLTCIIHNLAARGRPVTTIIYTLLLNWVPDVAHDLVIPSVLYWIQPAFGFAVYYHYFHGYESLVSSRREDPLSSVNLPGLPPLQIRDLPSFLTMTSTDNPYGHIINYFGRMFEILHSEATRHKPVRVLLNTFDALEPDALVAVKKFDLIAIGPLLPSSFIDGKGSNDVETGGDLFKPDEKKYMEWLDSKPKGSVVYVSFGSLATLKKEQLQEISRGLAESGRPFLWVVRKDNREEGVQLVEEGENGMVVEWCSQVSVLSHTAVGCFVTHCGWNSTLESLVCGVPTVGVPQWSDQPMNAWLLEKYWGTGVRGEVNAEGGFQATELRRCLDLLMGEEERALEIRKKAAMWRDRALEAAREGGPSDRNLKAFSL